MSAAHVLIAGESWMSYGIHVKGFNAYTTGGYEVGAEALQEALAKAGHTVRHLPAHEAVLQFPFTEATLSDYDVVVLSDIGADTLQLHPDTFTGGKRTPDRLRLLGEFVAGGGSLLMVGGYMSFSGYEGKARYGMTPLAEVLPVDLLPHDDRIEAPEGVTPTVVAAHPIVAGLDDWPHFLGYNRLVAKPSATVLLSFDVDPLLTVWNHDRGRVAAFASDCAPHWGSPEFLRWDGYPIFWDQMIQWLCGAR